MITHSTICAILVNFLALPCVFGGATYLVFCGTKNALHVLAIVSFFSHNIATSLYCCNVDRCIPTIIILRYDFKPNLNIIVKILFMVGICKP